MAILKNPSRKKFTVVDNHALRDDNLSLKARGLLVTMLSLPNNWKFSETGLCALFKKDGQASIRSGLKELESSGYLVRRRTRDDMGRVDGVEWIIYDQPRLENRNVDNPSLDSQPQLNTKELSTDLLSTEYNITPYNPPEGEQQKPKRKRKSDSAEDVEAAIKAFGYPESTNERLHEWLEVRNAKRTPNTVSAIQKCIKTLPEMARKSNLGIDAYLDQVIMRGWAAFYEIKAYQPNNGAYSRNPEPPAPQYREAK